MATKLPKKEIKAEKEKMQMYVNRETGLAPESPSDHKQQRRPSVRPGQGAGS